jgi:hypothetical protein
MLDAREPAPSDISVTGPIAGNGNLNQDSGEYDLFRGHVAASGHCGKFFILPCLPWWEGFE